MSHPIPAPILVTGAGGFIGIHLVNRLLADGYPVIAYDLPSAPIPAAWEGRATIIHGDITDAESIERAAAGARTIVHLAAMVGDWGDDQLFDRITVEGSRQLFDAALKHKSKVVLISSYTVHGEKIDQGLLTEELPFGKFYGSYSRTKQAQERLAWEYHLTRGLPLTVIRPTNVFGPGSKLWTTGVAHELKKGLPTLIDGGNFCAGLVYIENLIDILVLAASSSGTNGRVYFGYDGTPATWKQYLSEIAAIIGAPTPKPMPRFVARAMAITLPFLWKTLRIQSRPLFTMEAYNLVGSRHNISMERLRNELGYSPRVSYEEAMRNVKAFLLK